jgi:hypothetical protein
MPAVCSITFRRQSIIELGGVPETFASQYEDQALIAKLLAELLRDGHRDCLARYRQHGESLTHRAMESGEYRPGRPHENASSSSAGSWSTPAASASMSPCS